MQYNRSKNSSQVRIDIFFFNKLKYNRTIESVAYALLLPKMYDKQSHNMQTGLDMLTLRMLRLLWSKAQ